jgi:hypothetical protein
MVVADEAKANFVSAASGRGIAPSAQPQKACGQQINDFLVRVPWLVGGGKGGDGFEFVHGERSDGKRLSCQESRGLRVTCLGGLARDSRRRGAQPTLLLATRKRGAVEC